MSKMWYMLVRVVMSSLEVHEHLAMYPKKKEMHVEARGSKWIEND